MATGFEFQTSTLLGFLGALKDLPREQRRQISAKAAQLSAGLFFGESVPVELADGTWEIVNTNNPHWTKALSIAIETAKILPSTVASLDIQEGEETNRGYDE